MVNRRLLGAILSGGMTGAAIYDSFIFVGREPGQLFVTFEARSYRKVDESC